MKFFISLTLLSAVTGFADFHDGRKTCPEIKDEDDCNDMMGCMFDEDSGCVGTDGGMEEIDYLALMPGGVGLNLINNK